MPTFDQNFDQNQQAVQRQFKQLVERQSDAITDAYLHRFGAVLSTRLACELSENFRHSDLTRGYYRPAIAHTAELIIQHVWERILETSTPPRKPVLIIAGGGPGSGKLTALVNPLLSLKKQILCSYDASTLPTETLEELITDAHKLDIPTILTNIQRRMAHAAYSSIARTLRESLNPDAAAFATAHHQSYKNFQYITGAYCKQKQLFVSTAVLNPGHPDEIHSTKLSTLAGSYFSTENAERTYSTILDQMTASTTTFNFSSSNTPARKAQRAPRSTKTIAGKSSLITYLLSQSLRSTLIAQERGAASHSTIQRNNLQPPSPETSAPTKSLMHTRSFETSDQQLDISHTRNQTQKGQEEALANQRPTRTLVRETTTHIHEMETILVR